jgi:hypothetical protein
MTARARFSDALSADAYGSMAVTKASGGPESRFAFTAGTASRERRFALAAGVASRERSPALKGIRAWRRIILQPAATAAGRQSRLRLEVGVPGMPYP